MKGLGRLSRHLRHSLKIEMPRLRPVVSVFTIVATLFLLVFLQMEERRLSYGVLKLGRLYREKIEDRRSKEIQLARSLRLEKMEKMASRKLTLRKTVSDQVIHLNDELLSEPNHKKTDSPEKKISKGSESGKTIQ